ncbi:MAG: hypothetical protein QXI12_13085 [Candidatus Methanomethyliaceae archaeon]
MSLIVLWRITKHLHLSRALATLLFLIFAFYYPLQYYITRGFETNFFTLFFLFSLLLSLGTLQFQRHIPPTLLALALLVTIRPEALLYCTVAGFYITWSSRFRLRQFVSAYVLPVILFLIILAIVYGYPVPNTYYAKNAGGRIGKFLNGLDYFALGLCGGGTLLALTIPYYLSRLSLLP